MGEPSSGTSNCLSRNKCFICKVGGPGKQRGGGSGDLVRGIEVMEQKNTLPTRAVNPPLKSYSNF